MLPLIDLTGKKFGRLQVIRRVGTDKRKQVLWLCLCDCGTERTVIGVSLRFGRTRSCGCLQRTCRITHGMRRTPIWCAWRDIKNRCFNPKLSVYQYYGARGIGMYEPWIKDFKAFYDYVSGLPGFGVPGLSLDRIDNDRGYFPGNLRWATQSQQMKNRQPVERWKGKPGTWRSKKSYPCRHCGRVVQSKSICPRCAGRVRNARLLGMPLAEYIATRCRESVASKPDL